MVGDVLGVRRADADVDQRHALAVARDEVIGGHLEPVPWARGDGFLRSFGNVAAPDLGAARQHHALVGTALGEPCQAPAHELVDVAVIVGEQNPLLHVAPVAARIVHEPAQRVVDAHRIEQGERTRLSLRHLPLAVHHLVADEGEQRGGKMARKLAGGYPGPADVVDALQHVRVGDLLAADLDCDLGVVLGDQGLELLEQVPAEVVRVRDRRRIDARPLELGERTPRARRRSHLAADDAQQRIAESSAILGRRRLAGRQIAVERARQRRAGAGIDRLQAIDSRLGRQRLLVVRFPHATL